MTRTSIRTGALLALLLLPLATRDADAQETPQLRLSSDLLTVTLNGRLNTQLATTTVETVPAWDMFIRRARLELGIEANELVSGALQADFAGDRVSVKDAFVQLNFSPGFNVLAGHAKRPFSLLELTSSVRMMPIERGLRIRGVQDLDLYGLVSSLEYSDRAVGLQLLGAPADAPLGLTYAAGIFPGPLQGELGAEDTWQGAARVTIAPLPDVRVGAGWSGRDFLAMGSAGVLEFTRGNAFEVDLEVGSFAAGPHLIAEAAIGDAGGEDGFTGIQTWLGYRINRTGRLTAIEPIARVSYVDAELLAPGETASGGTLLTPGVNLYLGGSNRVQFNYDFWNPSDGDDAEGSFKAQFQLRF